MIRKVILILFVSLILISCGKKGDPEYVDPDKKTEINEVSINLT